MNGETASKVLLKVKDSLAAKGIGCNTINFSFRAPENGDKTDWSHNNDFQIYDFKYNDIYEDGLVNRLDRAKLLTKEKIAVQDAEKQAEIANVQKNQND